MFRFEESPENDGSVLRSGKSLVLEVINTSGWFLAESNRQLESDGRLLLCRTFWRGTNHPLELFSPKNEKIDFYFSVPDFFLSSRAFSSYSTVKSFSPMSFHRFRKPLKTLFL
jgi:hypothetical protein